MLHDICSAAVCSDAMSRRYVTSICHGAMSRRWCSGYSTWRMNPLRPADTLRATLCAPYTKELVFIDRPAGAQATPWFPFTSPIVMPTKTTKAAHVGIIWPCEAFKIHKNELSRLFCVVATRESCFCPHRERTLSYSHFSAASLRRLYNFISPCSWTFCNA